MPASRADQRRARIHAAFLLLYLKAPLCKELFVRRRKRSLQLHVMLLRRTASILLLRRLIVRLAAAACCCWHRELQWRVEKANLEIFILQGSSHSLCKELMLSPRVWSGFILKDRVGPHASRHSGSHCCAHWRAPKIKENRGFGHQNSQFFLACRRSQCLRRLKRVFPDFTRFCSHIFGFRDTAMAAGVKGEAKRLET